MTKEDKSITKVLMFVIIISFVIGLFVGTFAFAQTATEMRQKVYDESLDAFCLMNFGETAKGVNTFFGEPHCQFDDGQGFAEKVFVVNHKGGYLLKETW